MMRLVIPSASWSRSELTKLGRSSSGVASGTSRFTRSARSRMMPVGSPIASCSIMPADGCGVSRVMPASFSASELATEL